MVRVLERLSELRGLPQVLVTDNGPEFAGQVLDVWAYERGIKLHFIQPGKPIQNAFIESFNGKMRDGCLNQHRFRTVREARQTIEAWRRDYSFARQIDLHMIKPCGKSHDSLAVQFASGLIKIPACGSVVSLRQLDVKVIGPVFFHTDDHQRRRCGSLKGGEG